MAVLDDVKRNMQKAIDHFSDELRNLRTNRPNPAILDAVSVEIYGTEMRLRDLATVSVSDGRQLLVSPFDPQTVGAISKGIEKANLGLQSIVDGHMVRVPIPPMSEELRKEIAKDARDKSEKTKVSIREFRRKANDTIKKLKTSSEISEDEQKKTEKKVQELTDQYCKKVDELYTQKEKDILEV